MSFSPRTSRFLATLALSTALAVLIPASLTLAAAPDLIYIFPRGGQAGTEVEVSFTGDRFSDAVEIMFHDPGIEATSFEVNEKNQRLMTVKLKIAEDARLGEHRMRVRTKSGISPMRTFWVGRYPDVTEVEPNSTLEEAQAPEQKNITVNGIVGNANGGLDRDYYVLEAKKGERVSAEVEAFRLGTGGSSSNIFPDFVLTIHDAQGNVLAESDDTPQFQQDPMASIVAPADGKYYVCLRDTVGRGNGVCHYRMHLGNFSRPTGLYPAGGQPGQKLTVTVLGDPAGPRQEEINIPKDAVGLFPVSVKTDGVVAPSPNYIRISPEPNILEQEPNNTAEEATLASPPLPVALNGIIGEPGDVDYFRFMAAKGDRFTIRVFASDIGSPLDASVRVRGPGVSLAGEDEGRDSLDPEVRFAAKEDGEHTLMIKDLLDRGSPEHFYRIEFLQESPAVYTNIPTLDRNEDRFQRNHGFLVVPRGGRSAQLVAFERSGYNGDLTLLAKNLPKGVTMTAPAITEGMDRIPVVFEAAKDAEVAGTFVELLTKPAEAADSIKSGYRQDINLQWGPNNRSFLRSEVDQLASAVVEEIPFSIRVEEPVTPIVQNGEITLQVIIDKQEGWDEEVQLNLLWLPPGVSGAALPRVPKGTNVFEYPVNASTRAPVGGWETAISAMATDSNGTYVTCSQMIKMSVIEPFISISLGLTKVQQGKSAEVACRIKTLVPFDGKATATLKGLPPGVTSESPTCQITSEDTACSFELAADPRALIGQYRTLYVEVVAEKDGNELRQVAGRGILRIDVPKIDLDNIRTEDVKTGGGE